MNDLLGQPFEHAVGHLRTHGHSDSDLDLLRAIEGALRSPGDLSAQDRLLLPRSVAGALDADSHALLEEWLHTRSVIDEIWRLCSHCPHDRTVVAHLVQAATNGPTPQIAQFLGRDLLRLSLLPSSVTGGCARHPRDDVGALRRFDEAHSMLKTLDVTVGPFFDIYDALLRPSVTTPEAGPFLLESRSASGPPPKAMEVTTIRARGVGSVAASRRTADAAPVVGTVLILGVGGLYDRQVVSVIDVGDAGALLCVDLVSELLCEILPSLGGSLPALLVVDDGGRALCSC